jgi:hypothetical protein
MNVSPPACSLVSLLSCRTTSKRLQPVNLANLTTSLDPNDRPRTLSDILDEAIRLANETFDSDFGFDIDLEGSSQQEYETADNVCLNDSNSKGLASGGGRLPP